MAITINSAANSKAPAYNQLVYDISSNNTGNPNFNFVVDIYVGGNLITRQLYPKQPSGSSVKVDVSPIVQNYVSYDLPQTSSGVLANHQANYYVQFGEAYDVSGVLTIYPDLTRHPNVSGTQAAFNSVFDFEEFTPNIMADYNASGFGFLTTIPETITINPDDKLMLAFYDPNIVVNNIRITNGTSVDDSFAGLGSTNFYRRFDFSLLAEVGFSWALGDYTYQFRNVSNAVLASGVIRVENYCSKYPKFRLHWLNKLGGWDSYNFGKVSQESISVDSREFKAYQTLGYNTSDRLITRYNTMVKDTITIQTDWISDNMADWFKGLFESPIVLLERPTTGTNYDMVAINIVERDYQVRKFANGRQLNNIQVSFQYSYDRYRQSL